MRRNMTGYIIASTIALLALFLFVTFFPRGAPTGKELRNLLLITIDTLRADHVGIYGSSVETPVMDSLARNGVLYEHAFSQVPITLPSHATILTGMYPFEHGIRHNGKYRLLPGAVTLAEELKGKGYHTAAFIGAYVLNRKYGLDQGFEVYDDDMPGDRYPGTMSFRDRTAREVTDRVLAWLSRPQEPFFLWVHYFDPHKPYAPPPPFDGLYEDPYDGEVAYVDMELGRLMRSLSEKGLEQRTMVVLTSDHGESLGEHGELTHAIFVYSATTHVPLIMSSPGVLPRGERRDRVTELAEIKSCVMNLLENAEGVLTGTGGGDMSSGSGEAYAESWAPRLQYGWSELKSIRDGHFLYVRAPKPELYDLTGDPDELVNIHADYPDIAGRYAYTLDSLVSQADTVVVSESVEVSDEERDLLEELGYVFPGESPDSEDVGLEDPKDMIQLHRVILSGWKLLLDEDYEGAAALFEEILVKDESDPAIHLGLGLAYDGMGNDARARVHLERAIELDPLEERSYYALSNLLRDMGLNEKAADVLGSLVEIYPFDPIAWRSYARILTRAGRADRARDAYEKALELEPEDGDALFEYGRFLAVRGDYQHAAELLGKLVELDPRNAGALSLLGASEARLGRLEMAEKHFRSAVRLQPGRKEVWVDLATVLVNLERREEARSCLMKALAIDPDYEPAVRALADLEAARSEG